jgi:hypothetical protein
MRKLKNSNVSLISFLSLIILSIVSVITLLTHPSNAKAGSIIDTNIEPSQITAGVSESVTVTAEITDNNLVPINLELQQVDDNGNVIENLGELTNSGNGVFTTQIIITESSSGSIKFRISAFVENLYKPIFSDIFTLEVVQ